jgi:hypothetical protein
LLLNTADCSKEFHLVEVATAYTSSVINSFAIEVLLWLKKHNVEWLKNMASIHREVEDINQLILVEFQDFTGYMTAIAITQENLMSANLSLL